MKSSALATALLFVVCSTEPAASADLSKAEKCERAAAAIDLSMRGTLAAGSPGMVVAVAQGEHVFYARTLGLANVEHQVPLRRQHVFAIASLTKQFTAAAILLLQEDGKLKLEDRLDRYVPELPQAQGITLYQLLTHTSGLPDYAEDDVGQQSKAVAHTTTEMVAWISSLAPAQHFAPGTAWRYSNSNYALLGAVIERVGKTPLSQFYTDRLFRPAGLTATFYDDPGRVIQGRVQGYKRAAGTSSGFANAAWISPTIPGAAGGLRSTADDLVKWTNALFAGHVLKPSSLRWMTSPGLLSDGRTTKSGMPEAWQKGLNADYAMGLFVNETPVGRRIWHGGDVDGFSTWLAHYPERDLTVALLQNSESADMDRDAISNAAIALGQAGCDFS